MLVAQCMKLAAAVAAMLLVGCSNDGVTRATSPGGGTQPGTIDTSTSGHRNGDMIGGMGLISSGGPIRDHAQGNVRRRK